LNPEESVSISGALTPAQATTVELIYQRPDGFEMTKHLTTTSTGTYTDTVKPEIPGMWSVKSRWQGDEKHFSAESSAANFFVQAPQENPWPLLFAVILIALVIVIAALVVRKRGGTTVSKLSVTQISKRYCAKCGSEIPEGSTYCMKCGEKA
jgi:ribosomal protein L40E